MADAVRIGARVSAVDRFLPSRLLRAREAGVFFALLAMCLFLSIATDGFLTSLNLFNVGRQVSLLARLHPLGGIVEANALKSLGRESKGRHYRG